MQSVELTNIVMDARDGRAALHLQPPDSPHCLTIRVPLAQAVRFAHDLSHGTAVQCPHITMFQMLAASLGLTASHAVLRPVMGWETELGDEERPQIVASLVFESPSGERRVTMSAAAGIFFAQQTDIPLLLADAHEAASLACPGLQGGEDTGPALPEAFRDAIEELTFGEDDEPSPREGRG